MKAKVGEIQDQARQRRTIIIAIIIALVEFVVVLIVSLPELIPEAEHVPNFEYIIIGNLLGFLLVLGGIWLARNNRLRAAGWLLMSAVGLSLFPVVLILGSIGVILGLIGMVLISGVGTLTLPSEKTSPAIMMGLTTALVIIALDIFGSSNRVFIDSQFTVIVAIVLVVIFGLLMAWQFPTYPIRIKLIFALLGATLTTAAILAVFAQNSTQAILRQNTGSHLKNTVENAAISIGNQIQNQVNQLIILSLDESLQTGLSLANEAYKGSEEEILTEINRLDKKWIALSEENKTNDPLIESTLQNAVATDIKLYGEQFPANVEILVTDRYGALIAATNLTSDYYQGDESWWQAAFAGSSGGIYISQPSFDESSKSLAFLIAVPIRDKQTNDVIGILRTTYPIAELYPFLEAQTETAERLELLFPGDNPLKIAEGILTTTDGQSVSIVQDAIDKNFVEVDYLGIPTILSSTQVNSNNNNPSITGLGWLVGGYLDRAKANIPITRQNQITLLIVFAVAGLVSLASLFLAQYINRPILALTEAAQKIAMGQFDARANVTSGDEIGTLAASFNSMTQQLRDLIGTLEQRVTARTRALQTTVDVSRRLSTILDQKQLAQTVVDEIQNSFNYYHVHIYLFDEFKEKLVMVGGTGEAGRIMLEKRHFIARGRGLVGQAAENNLVVLAPDTRSDPNWLPNPLLPETRAEIAVPIAIGQNVLGVLDVQHNSIEGLGAQDAELIQSIANQVAVAIQNARSYSQIQHQADRETIINTISQRIQTAGSPEAVLQIAARELALALSAQKVIVQIDSRSVLPEDHQEDRDQS